jgi:hypothetical protein
MHVHDFNHYNKTISTRKLTYDACEISIFLYVRDQLHYRRNDNTRTTNNTTSRSTKVIVVAMNDPMDNNLLAYKTFHIELYQSSMIFIECNGRSQRTKSNIHGRIFSFSYSSIIDVLIVKCIIIDIKALLMLSPTSSNTIDNVRCSSSQCITSTIR